MNIVVISCTKHPLFLALICAMLILYSNFLSVQLSSGLGKEAPALCLHACMSTWIIRREKGWLTLDFLKWRESQDERLSKWLRGCVCVCPCVGGSFQSKIPVFLSFSCLTLAFLLLFAGKILYWFLLLLSRCSVGFSFEKSGWKVTSVVSTKVLYLSRFFRFLYLTFQLLILYFLLHSIFCGCRYQFKISNAKR